MEEDDDTNRQLFTDTVDISASTTWKDISSNFQMEADQEKSMRPYQTQMGEGDTAFHDDQAKLRRIIAKGVYKQKELGQDTIRKILNNEMSTEDWVFVANQILSRDKFVLEYVQEDEVSTAAMILCRSWPASFPVTKPSCRWRRRNGPCCMTAS